MVSLVSQSPSLRTSVVNSSRLSGQEQVTTQNQLVLQEITEEGQICQSQKTESNHVHIIESLFEGCQKCNGLIGVPITYMASHCNEQMEIIGHAHGDAGVALGITPYPRELKRLNKGLRDGDFYIIKDGIPIIPYNRIVIRRRKEYI